jgi:hypothetical protein
MTPATIRLVAVLVVGVGTLGANGAAFSVPRWSRPERPVAAFRINAAAAAATADTEWRLSTRGSRIGLIMSVAVCGNEAFLLDRQLGVVHRADLNAGAITGDATSRGIHQVAGLAADCSRRLLYIVDGKGVGVFNMDSGAPLAHFSKPDNFANSIGAPVLDETSSTLAVQGVWSSRRNWRMKPADRMFEQDRIGYRVDLATGRTSPMVAAVERGCWSLGPNCVYATLDGVAGSQRARWVAAHFVGMAVGVYDAGYRQLRVIDIRSPQFLENGERNEREVITEMVAWNEDNSVIRQVYGFGDRIVTVHSYNRTRGWQPGGQIDFNVFMNVHTVDGAGVVSDVRLRDLPVGRDDSGLYVVDYGNAGRRPLGSDSIWLVRVAIPQ